jgi:hypothetical protein
MKKKLRLDDLKVDGFATTAAAPGVRGTVVGHEGTTTCPPETADCYVSWDGTCYFTCFDTCQSGCTAVMDC